MNNKLPFAYHLSPDVVRARSLGLPIVALESTVITHGLPSPENLELARDMENQVRGQGSVPATIAVIEGKVCVGLNEAQLEWLSQAENIIKISSRDLGPAVARSQSGGTTVAATMAAAYPAGIRVFATGGIGGVHRQLQGEPASAFDISADLEQLARLPMIVVCAGAKAILDLPATLEVLETLAVPVVGYQTNDFPAFYSVSSGLPTSTRADSPEEIARMAKAHWELGSRSAVLVVQPPPIDYAMPNEVIEEAVRSALQEASRQNIRGQGVTPFLLSKVKEITSGSSLKANLSLLLKNAQLAGQIARFFSPGLQQA